MRVRDPLLSPTQSHLAASTDDGQLLIYRHGQRAAQVTIPSVGKTSQLIWTDATTLTVGLLDGSLRILIQRRENRPDT